MTENLFFGIVGSLVQQCELELIFAQVAKWQTRQP